MTILEIDELRMLNVSERKTFNGNQAVWLKCTCVGTKIMLTHNIPCSSRLMAFNSIKKGDVIIEWDPFNAVIVSEVSGKIEFESLVENVTG